ncbi:MAG: PKD domain-containing protein, partial [Methanoregula sp.]|nr:PKD domain-containing protein [Methanoregula sp.]
MNKKLKNDPFVYLPDSYKRWIEGKKRWRLIKKTILCCTVIVLCAVIFLFVRGELSGSLKQQPAVLLAPIDESSETSLQSIPVSLQTEKIPSARSIRSTQTASNKPPDAQFTADTFQGSDPLTVQFTDQSTGTAPLTYAWDFTNDGSTDSTVKNPSFTYKTAGICTVKLTVTNADGSDSEIKPGYITVASPVTTTPPIAQFTANLVQGNSP